MVGISVLSSGSSGNAVVVSSTRTSILIDDGLSFKRLKELADMAAIDLEKTDALLVTHEHRDHVAGVEVLLRKMPLPVFLSGKVAGHISFPKEAEKMAEEISQGDKVTVGDITFRPFLLPHDATETFGFAIEAEGIRIGYACDLGTFTSEIADRLAGSHCLMLEFNHDLDMLHDGPYPEKLKLRIASKLGHLSNGEASKLLSKCLTDETRALFLMHLSKETNTPEFAQIAAMETVAGRDIFVETTQHLHPSRAFRI